MTNDRNNAGTTPAPESAKASERGYALFDLDHTLLPFDTQALFCNFILQREPWRAIYLLWFLPVVPLVVVKLVSLRWMKRLFCSYLWGMPKEKLDRYAKEFAEEVVTLVAYPKLRAEVKRHREEGRVLILNSASPEIYVSDIARVLGFDHWVATKLAPYEKMPFLPEIIGPNNKHGAKIPAMRHLLPESFDETSGVPLPDSWGYSDSSADVPLLSICERGVMIHPSERFAAIGKDRGWETFTPDRPYRGKWGGRLASILQALGPYRVRQLSGDIDDDSSAGVE